MKEKLKDLSLKVNITIQAVFTSRKIEQELNAKEAKPPIVNEQVDTTIYYVTKGYAISAIVKELKMKLMHFLLDCPSFSSIGDMFFFKLEPKIPFLRLQSHESLLSHLMNSTDYFINVQLISFISTCFELGDKLISGI